ncbi:MAG: peptidylprolyl isomerase [Proteobacteria bacterium]|nr:MAG: peptidylprolyl isomerase [Pseudomonadota bacterium]
MKFLSGLLFVLILGLAGCGGGGSGVNTEAPKTPASASEQTTAQVSNRTTETTSGDKTVSGNPKVLLETSKGNITLALDAEKAPLTVANFLSYVREGFYDGTTFHRVIPGFMIQGGGMDAEMKEKQTKAPIQNEANNGLLNVIGSIAMARTSAPHSASSQFFINVADNAFLDFKNESMQGWGYAVFGKVTDGMDVVNAIVAVPTTNKKGHQNVPVDAVTITKASVVE